jgi:hypothetical protein
VCSQPNPLCSTVNLLANPFSFSSLKPTPPSHNVRAHPSRRDPALCRFHGCPCTLRIPRVRRSIYPLNLEIAAGLLAILPDSSDVVPRDESLVGIRNCLHLRQDPRDQQCNDKYRDSYCFFSLSANSGDSGTPGCCVCWYDDYLGEGDTWCREIYFNEKCAHNQKFLTIGPNASGVSQGGCACPPPPFFD